MTDDFSEENRDFDFEKIEIEAYQKRLKEMIAAIGMIAFSLLLFVGFLCFIITGDLQVLSRTSMIAVLGILLIGYIFSRIAYTEPPAQPLPNHPDMMREDES